MQRVTQARVWIAGREHARIGPGLLVFVGVEDLDNAADVEWMGRKLVELRIFSPATGGGTETLGSDSSREQSVLQIGGDLLLISQFTLFASTRKGTRPSWQGAAKPIKAIPVYEALHRRLAELMGRPVPSGVFGAEMLVELTNDGPVTLWLDSRVRE